MIVTLNYHRCHGRDCEGKHPAKTFTSQPEELRKGWKRCRCPIIASGSLDRIHKRMATKQTEWAKAIEMMAPYIAANSWTPPLVPPPAGIPVASPPPSSEIIQLKTAAAEYVEAHRLAKSAATTNANHRWFTRKVVRFSEDHGISLNQWTQDDTRKFLAQFAAQADTTRVKYHKRLKALFNWCKGTFKSLGWSESPAELDAVIHNRATKLAMAPRQKFPFTNLELERMFAACLRYDSLMVCADGKVVARVGEAPNRSWGGEDLADFIAISIYTGLRISDVATFNANRLRGADEIHVRATKNAGMIYTAVPLWLADRIRSRAEKFGPLIFGSHASSSLAVATASWRKRLVKLWQQSGPWEGHPTPHRFRHTFARILLQNGRTIADVAELLGDTENVVRENYAAWVPERQERISKLLRESFANVPVPKHIVRKKAPKVIQMVKQG